MNAAAEAGSPPDAPPRPMDGPELAARLSRLSATARWRAGRCDLAGVDGRADLWRTIELLADVLMRVEGLDATDYLADRGDEDAFLRDAVAGMARLGGSVGGGRGRSATRSARYVDGIAADAVKGIRDSVLALLGRVA